MVKKYDSGVLGEKMTKIKIEITEKFLEVCGSNSLTGAIINQLENIHDFQNLDLVILVFPQTSDAWRKANKGPREFIIPEYSLFELLKDIENLRKIHQIKIKIEKKTINPE